jgi:hypothetical protein
MRTKLTANALGHRIGIERTSQRDDVLWCPGASCYLSHGTFVRFEGIAFQGILIAEEHAATLSLGTQFNAHLGLFVNLECKPKTSSLPGRTCVVDDRISRHATRSGELSGKRMLHERCLLAKAGK